MAYRPTNKLSDEDKARFAEVNKEWVYTVWRCSKCKWDSVKEYSKAFHATYAFDKEGKPFKAECMNKSECGEKKRVTFLKFVDERTAYDFCYPNGGNPFPWDEWKVLEEAVAEWKALDPKPDWYPAHKLDEYRKTKALDT